MNPHFIVAGVAALAFGADAFARQWEAVPSLPTPRVHAVGIAQGTMMLALGGTPLDANQDAPSQALTIGAASWGEVARMDGPQIRQGGGIDSQSRTVVFGGYHAENGDIGATYVYNTIDGRAGTLANRPGQSSPEGFAWAADELRRLYSIGGRPRTGSVNRSECLRYDATTNTWFVLAPMIAGVDDACAASDGAGHVLVFGGFNQAGNGRTSNVAAYDIATNTWSDTIVPDMPLAVAGARAVLGADNRVYVMGGSDAAGAAVNLVQVLNLFTNTWSAGVPMSTAREHFGAARGADNSIYVMGGENASGGIALCERLYTPPCPSFTLQPDNAQAWAGAAAGFTTQTVGGGTITYQWRKDGVPITDGPSGTGSTIIGSTAASLGILGIAAPDVGAYDVVATNPCGSTTSPGATITLHTTPPVPTTWTATSLHYGNYSSGATAVVGGRVFGYFQAPDARRPDYLYFNRAAFWEAGSTVPMDLTPSESVLSYIASAGGGKAVGHWFKPYTTSQGVGYYMRPGVWNLDDMSFSDLPYAGQEYGRALATDGTIAVGYSFSDFDDGGGLAGQQWNLATGGWNVFFPPLVGDKLFRTTVDAGVVYGTANARAARITGATTWVDMHPAGHQYSDILGAGDSQQVGSASARPILWCGTPNTAVDLAPAGVVGRLGDCRSGWQVGSLVDRATVWVGSAASAFDLHQFSPGYATSHATGIDFLPDGRAVVVGYALKLTPSPHYEAMKWTAATPPPACPGDLNNDGQRNTADLTAFLGAFGQSVPPGSPGDLNADGAVNTADLTAMLGVFGTPCN